MQASMKKKCADVSQQDGLTASKSSVVKLVFSSGKLLFELCENHLDSKLMHAYVGIHNLKQSRV